MNTVNSSQHNRTSFSVLVSVGTIAMMIFAGLYLVSASTTAANRGEHIPETMSVAVTNPLGDQTGLSMEVSVGPGRLDHSTVNQQDLPDDHDPSPNAVAAFR
jgi:hypothetical protein